jgi:serine/threonine protein kinase
MELDVKTLESKDYKNPIIIGIGVFGRVYSVENKNGEKKCVKIIPVNKFDEKEWKTSTLLKNYDCSNVIVYSKKEEANNLILLEMEYMNGGDLKSFIDKSKSLFSTETILDMVKQICFSLLFLFFFLLVKGVRVIHSCELAHRFFYSFICILSIFFFF